MEQRTFIWRGMTVTANVERWSKGDPWRAEFAQIKGIADTATFCKFWDDYSHSFERDEGSPTISLNRLLGMLELYEDRWIIDEIEDYMRGEPSHISEVVI